MRGGKDWSWTLHLQSAQWVVLATTSFSPSLAISLMLLTWSPHFPHALPFPCPYGFFLQFLAEFDLSRRPPLRFDLSGFSFAVTFPSSEQSYIFLRTLGHRWILLPNSSVFGKVVDYLKQDGMCMKSCGQRAAGQVGS